MLQGMTAHYLAVDTYPVRRGDTILVHAAAGGVGLLLVQVARMRGARVIATVSTPEKAALAKVKSERDGQAVASALRALERTAKDETANVMPDILQCVKSYATLQEICDALRRVFGEAAHQGL